LRLALRHRASGRRWYGEHAHGLATSRSRPHLVGFALETGIVVEPRAFGLGVRLHTALGLLHDMGQLVTEALLSLLGVWLVLRRGKVDIRVLCICHRPECLARGPS
jgi:hypothetical protein